MKRLMLLFGFLCIIGVFSTSALAVPVVYNDLYWNPTFIDRTDNIGSNNYHEWTHNINGTGFDPELDNLTSVSLTLFLADDYNGFGDIFDDQNKNVRRGNLEFGRVTVEGQNYFTGEIDFGWYTIQLDAYVTLQETGLLDVKLVGRNNNATNLHSDFWFLASYLTANGERTDAAPVPEPATMLLFGSGLVGVAAIRRKKSAR